MEDKKENNGSFKFIKFKRKIRINFQRKARGGGRIQAQKHKKVLLSSHRYDNDFFQ